MLGAAESGRALPQVAFKLMMEGEQTLQIVIQGRKKEGSLEVQGSDKRKYEEISKPYIKPYIRRARGHLCQAPQCYSLSLTLTFFCNFSHILRAPGL